MERKVTPGILALRLCGLACRSFPFLAGKLRVAQENSGSRALLLVDPTHFRSLIRYPTGLICAANF
jgi:hypothetical protein